MKESANAGEESPSPQDCPQTPSYPDPSSAAVRAASGQRLMPAMKLLAGALGTTVLWCSVWQMLQNAPLGRDAVWHLSLPTLILTVILLLVYRENRKWRQPVRRLSTMLRGCRAGELPIDELKVFGGGVAEVAEVAQALLHDLREQRRITAQLEEELRQRVANRTSALERQMSSLRMQAMRDPLTGLHNRRMLEECLPKMIQQCRADGGELSILAIDVDNFKTLNDSLGHAMGDEFLRSIAQILRSGVRECDTAIRCGGDEFIVLLPGCPLVAARSLGERLVAMVGSLAKTVKSPLPPGLSVGAASLKRSAVSSSMEQEMSGLLEAADKQLYLNKASRKRKAA